MCPFLWRMNTERVCVVKSTRRITTSKSKRKSCSFGQKGELKARVPFHNFGVKAFSIICTWGPLLLQAEFHRAFPLGTDASFPA